jgi:hypothetical protein
MNLLELLTRLHRVDQLVEAVGRIEARQSDANMATDIQSHEFKAFSQSGEDGIIDFLTKNMHIAARKFVEFGVEDYQEANTRFLALTQNWSGLVMDANPEHVRTIRRDSIYWRCDLMAITAFVTRENVNTLLAANGISGEIGLLSIDIDGNDYWVWEAIDCIDPAIVVIEYNHRLGRDRAIAVPYDPHFDRAQAHSSRIYYGASLKALVRLGERKAYTFVGCNSFGVNAFFVRNDLMTKRLASPTVEEGYVAGRFREARDAAGRLAYLTAAEELAILRDLPFVDLGA